MAHLSENTELSHLERNIYQKVAKARFPAATASKRFMQCDPDFIRLSDKGRAFLAFIAHRFRRQYALTDEEWAWVKQWKRDSNAS